MLQFLKYLSCINIPFVDISNLAPALNAGTID